MKHWAWTACVAVGAGLVASVPALCAEGTASTAKPASSRIVVDIKPDRIVLMDVALAGNRLVAVGERGFTLVSDNEGKAWQARGTPVDRTLTGVAFRDDKTGVAVGHGGTVIRTEDGGERWTHVPLEEAGPDSLLGVTWLGDDHFVAYGAFGLYFDSTDAGRSWQRRMVLNEEFDRHISQVIVVGSSLVLVAESGTLLRSDDGGSTWTEIVSPYQGSYFGAVLTNSGALLVFGMRGNVYRTTDLGATWTKIPLDTTVSLMSGKQLSNGTLLLVGNSGLLADSRDDGQTLKLHWSPQRKGFSSFAQVGNQVTLVGETGVTAFDPAWLTDSEQAAR
jgi:photosystem II stability/assembly factor-like uncharacterized protein